MSGPAGTTKVCRICGLDLPLCAFPIRRGVGRNPRPHSYCRECRRKAAAKHYREHGEALKCRRRERQKLAPGKEAATRRLWRRANKEKAAAQHRRWYIKNRGRRSEWARAYRSKNRRALQSWNNRYCSERCRRDPAYLLSKRLRARLRRVLVGRVKHASVTRDLGCSFAALVAYFEGQFLPGMTWENYGRGAGCWGVDHIVPLLASRLVRIQDPLVQRKLCHYTNLRPLWNKDNLARNNGGALLAELSALGYLNSDGSVRFPCDAQQKEKETA